MRCSRLFVDLPLAAGQDVLLPAEAAHHLGVVLRAQAGQPVILFNNTGIEAQAVLVRADRKQVVAQVGSIAAVGRESPLAIHLAIGISRGERMDFVLQKSTELGVAAITPLFCERTEVKLAGERLQKKLQQWQKIIIGACEQSGRARVPLLHAPVILPVCLAADASERRFVLHHRSDQALAQPASRPGSVLLLVGPEGGLSGDEIAEAERAGCQPLALGPRVLRTETAPLAALAVLQFHWGDLGG